MARYGGLDGWSSGAGYHARFVVAEFAAAECAWLKRLAGGLFFVRDCLFTSGRRHGVHQSLVLVLVFSHLAILFVFFGSPAASSFTGINWGSYALGYGWLLRNTALVTSDLCYELHHRGFSSVGVLLDRMGIYGYRNIASIYTQSI